jgi:hypothetical protein
MRNRFIGVVIAIVVHFAAIPGELIILLGPAVLDLAARLWEVLLGP